MRRRKLVLLASLAPLVFAAPAAGQMNHANMPGMNMPAPKKPPAKKPAPKKPTAKAKSAPKSQSAADRKPVAKLAPKSAAQPKPAADPHAGHDMSSMPGMTMPAQQKPAADPHAGHDMSSMPGMATQNQPAGQPSTAHDMKSTPGMQMPGSGAATPGHDMSKMPGMQMPADAAGMPPGHDMQGMATMPGHGAFGTNLPAGNAAPPPVPTDHAADRVFSPQAMAPARHHLQTMHGDQKFYQVMFNLAEYQVRKGRDGFRWDAEAWYGGDINRLWLKTEGNGVFGRGVEDAEVQALFSRAIDPYWNVQAGIRYDLKPNPSRAYAVFGLEGLAPSFFDVETFLYLSNKGDVLGEIEASYDQRITQRLILQPRIDIDFAAQDVPENGIGSGLSSAQLGARLRYDIRREFAPYVGVEYERAFGDTADFRRAEGEDAAGWNFVLGVRTWF